MMTIKDLQKRLDGIDGSLFVCIQTSNEGYPLVSDLYVGSNELGGTVVLCYDSVQDDDKSVI